MKSLSLLALVILFSTGWGCDGSIVSLLPKECDAQNACPGQQSCHPDLHRCTTAEPNIPLVFMTIRMQEDGIQRLHTDVLPANFLSAEEGPITITIPESVLVRGNLGTQHAGSITIERNVPDWPTAPQISLRTSSKDPTFEVRLTPLQEYRFRLHSDVLEAPIVEVEESFDPSETANVNLAVPQDTELNLIPLSVLNQDQDPLKGAMISLKDSENQTVSGHVKTNAEGTTTLVVKESQGPFTIHVQDIPGVPGGSWQQELNQALDQIVEPVLIEIPITRSSLTNPETNEEESTVGEIQVTVLGQTGEEQEPLLGTRVMITRLSPGVEQTQYLSTDSTGSVRFQDLQPGLVLIAAVPIASSPFGLSTRAAWVSPNTIETAEMIATTRPKILGTIRKSDGELAIGYSVESTGSFSFETIGNKNISMSQNATTDPAGAYSVFSSLGNQRMLIMPPKGSAKPPATKRFFVEPQVGKASLEINVEMPPPFIRELIFENSDGTKPQDLQVELIWMDENAPRGFIHQFGVANSSGTWVLSLPGKVESLDEGQP